MLRRLRSHSLLRTHSLNKISLNKKVYLENSIQCSNCKFYIDGDKCSLYLKNNAPISTVEAREKNTLCGLTAKQFKLADKSADKYITIETIFASAFIGIICGSFIAFIKTHL